MARTASLADRTRPVKPKRPGSGYARPTRFNTTGTQRNPVMPPALTPTPTPTPPGTLTQVPKGYDPAASTPRAPTAPRTTGTSDEARYYKQLAVAARARGDVNGAKRYNDLAQRVLVRVASGLAKGGTVKASAKKTHMMPGGAKMSDAEMKKMHAKKMAKGGTIEKPKRGKQPPANEKPVEKAKRISRGVRTRQKISESLPGAGGRSFGRPAFKFNGPSK